MSGRGQPEKGGANLRGRGTLVGTEFPRGRGLREEGFI